MNKALDPSFAIDDYNKPKILTNKETLVNNILVVLFGKPGFYPSIPSLGMDIKQYLYKFEDEINTEEIKNKLSEQCNDFLLEIVNGEIDVQKTVYKGRILLIFVLPVVDDTLKSEITLGVTTNTRGEAIFKFIDNNKTQIL